MIPPEGNQPAPNPVSAGKTIAVHTLLTLGLFLSISVVPLAGFFSGILTPLPTVVAFLRSGYPVALAAPVCAGVAGSLVLVWLDMAESIPYLAAMLAMGAAMGYGMAKRWPTEKVIGLSSLVLLAVAGILVALAYLETGGKLVGLLEEDLQNAIKAMFKQLGTPSPEAGGMEAALLATVPTIVRIMPGITVSCALMGSWLNMLMARRYCRAVSIDSCVQENWMWWKAPDVLVWFVIAGGLMLLTPWGDLRYPALNLLIVLGSIYFLQGLAITAFYLQKWNMPFLFRGFIYAFLILQQFASLGTALLGLFDMWFDFRKMTKKPA